MPGNGVVTGYTIFENDHQIATITGTSYSVANLAANTTYTFSVTALDAAGSSAEANPISVHTAALGVPGDVSHAHEFSPYIGVRNTEFHACIRPELRPGHRLARHGRDHR